MRDHDGEPSLETESGNPLNLVSVKLLKEYVRNTPFEDIKIIKIVYSDVKDVRQDKHRTEQLC